MAILDNIPGLKVWISTANGPMAEHVDSAAEDAANTITRYIESVSGTNFAIHWRFEPNFVYRKNDMTVSVYLDGKEVDSFVHECTKLQHARGHGHKMTSARSRVGDKYFVQKFLFAGLAIDEENKDFHKHGLKEAVDAVGDISIRFHRCKILGKSEHTSTSIKLSQLETVPEKALKGRALSHKTSFGTAEPTARFNSVSTEWIDPSDKPLAAFNFRYRSLEALKALHIIPRTPEPVPLEERPIDELTLEETRELLRCKKEHEQIAAAKTRDAKQEEPGIKRERSPEEAYEENGEFRFRKRPRARPAAEIETIDLTSD